MKNGMMSSVALVPSAGNSLFADGEQKDAEQIVLPDPAIAGFSGHLINALIFHNPEPPPEPTTVGITPIIISLKDAFISVRGASRKHKPVYLDDLEQTPVLYGLYDRPTSPARAKRLNRKRLLALGITPPEGINHFIFFNRFRVKPPKPVLATTDGTAVVDAKKPAPPTRKKISLEPFLKGITDIPSLRSLSSQEITVRDIILQTEQRIALYLYRIFLKKPANYDRRMRDTHREEVLHCIQGVRKVPDTYMINCLAQQDGASAFFKGLVQTPLDEHRRDRDDRDATTLNDIWGKYAALWHDREFMAKLDKVLLRSKVFPETREDIVPMLKDLGLALGGLNDLEQTPLWDRWKVKDKVSVSLAELNIAIVSAFPDGAPPFFLEQALPYYIAMIDYTQRGDFTAFRDYGFTRDETLVFFKGKRLRSEIIAAFDRPTIAHQKPSPPGKDPA